MPFWAVTREKAVGRSDDVTLASLARAALAACAGNPEAAAEYILVQVMNDRKLLRSIFLPAIRGAIGDQILPQTTSAHSNVIVRSGETSGQPHQRQPQAITSEGPVKTPLRAPKIEPEWRTTIILAGVAVLLSAAVAIEVAARHF